MSTKPVPLYENTTDNPVDQAALASTSRRIPGDANFLSDDNGRTEPVVAKSWAQWGKEYKGNFKYAAVVALLIASGGYLGALYFAPALIPFGLTAMSTWTSMAVTGTMGLIASTSAYNTLPQMFATLMDTIGRLFGEKRLPTKTDMALLTTVVSLGLGSIAMLYLAPAMVPAVLAGLGTWSKLGVAGVTGAASIAAALPMFKIPSMMKEGYAANLKYDLENHGQDVSKLTL